MRVNTNVSNKTRRELVLDDFKGVDFSSSPLKVSGSRASFASNLICDNGVNHKRPGWEQVVKLSGKINGMYEYKGVLIVYAGTTFYKVENNVATPIYYEVAEGFKLQDQKVQFFPHKDRLYIIGPGDYLVYGTWDEGVSYELRRVADDKDTYVPTTSIYGDVMLESDDLDTHLHWVSQGASKSLENINLLTRRRKNTFIGVDSSAEQGCRYYTDSPIDKDSKIVVTYEYLVAEKQVDGSNVDGDIRYKIESKTLDDDDITLYVYEGFVSIQANLDSKQYCSGNDTAAWCNVTIEYDAVCEEGADTVWSIAKSTFGTTFGAYGNSDRLFLSGNPDMPNADFYSEFDDFTYFTAESQTVMGSKDQAIKGYIRLSDSTLATLKAPSVTEPTVYYRTASEVEVELPNGDKTSNVVFTRWTGGIGEGCVSSYCIATLAGDDLMLSENGLFGIVQVQNSANNDRYFRERDRFINSDLIKRNLSKATAIVYNNRYYLAVDGVCYVADPRYKTYRSDDIDGSFNYEWWYWENIPARVFAIVNGELWFGTEEGMICRFDDKFTDRTYAYSSKGDVSLSDDYTLNYSDNLEWIKEGQQITLLGAKEENELYIVNIVPNSDDVGGTFQLALHKDCDYESGVVTIKDYFDEVPDTFLIRVNYPLNVVSKWFSPVFDLGAFDVSKTLLSMSITVDPTVRGKVQFGYDTRDCEKTILRNSLGEGFFDYDAINFSDFSFEANFAASHTVRVKDRNFNYITFKLISDNDKDCAVCNLKAVYQYNGRLKGVH